VETDPAHAPKNQGKLHAVHHLFTIHCATWANAARYLDTLMHSFFVE
jgi:hypothetical protein